MKGTNTILVLVSLGVLYTGALTIPNQLTSRKTQRRKVARVFCSGEAVETDTERLLRRARELRAAAEKEEQQVHGDLTKKKADKDAQMDALIQDIFFDTNGSIVERLRSKRLGAATLENIIVRLDEREVIAKGMDHVEFKLVDGKVEFYRVGNAKDEKELARLDGLIDRLIQAVSVLDEEFLASKRTKGQSVLSYAEEEHLGGGKCAQRLQNRINQIRRERSEQFQKRMEEFREAQRRKDDPDHKFKGYTDLGTLN